jgi:type I restriction enzyme S subunit
MVDQGTLVSETYAGGKLCQRDDLVLNRLKAHLGVFALSRQAGVISPDYTVLRKTRSIVMPYFEYVLRSSACRVELRRRAKGIVEGFWRLYTDDLYDIRLPSPPLDEQIAIVRFLEHADRRIRRYIAAKKKLIALLDEQKQAMIRRAVTRGLDPDVRLRRSGVVWLGDVPENWEVARLKSRLERNDAGAWGTNFSDAGTVVLRSTEQTVSGSWNVLNPARRDLSDHERRRTLLRAGDLVVTKSSGSSAHIGKTSLVTPELESQGCGFSNFMQRLRVDARTSAAFVWLFLNNSAGRRQLVHGANSTTGLGNLSGTLLGNLWMAFPIRPEQERIVEDVSTVVAPFDMSAAKAQGLIDLMREFRTRLIADVVTGRLDVRDAAARLPDEVEMPELLADADALVEGDGLENEADLDGPSGEAEA